MAKRQRAEQLLNERQRRTILLMADSSYGLDAIAERFGFTIGEAKEAVRSCRDWARSKKGASATDWDAQYRSWVRDEVVRQIG